MKRGISLISLVIVIIVMVIIAGIIVVSGFSSIQTTKINTFALEILNIQDSVSDYYFRYEKYPLARDYTLNISNIESESLYQFDEETIIKFMENETADNIITDIVNSIYDYNLTGDESYKYTKQQIINLVEDNMDKILKEINYPITSEERQEVLDYTYNNTTYIIDTIYSTDIGDYKRW